MSNSTAKKLGAYVRRQREAAGLSQEALGAKAHLPHSTISRIEAGEFRSPRPDKLSRLARALDIPVEDLFAMAGYQTPEGLPDFPVYLRTKLAGELPAKARQELEDYYRMLREKYGSGGEGADV